VLPLPAKKPKSFYGYTIVLAGFFIMLVGFGTMYSYGVFFKPLSAEFGWTRAVTSGAYSLYMFLHGLFAIVTGRLNDRFGPRIVVGVCGLFLALGYFLMSQISTLWHVYLFYGVVIAIGMSGVFVPLTSVIARWFVRRRGMMTGIVVAGVGAGTMIMPPVSEWLISTYDWRTSFIAISILTLVVIIPATQFLKYDPSQMGLRPYGAEETKAGNPKAEVKGFSLNQALRTKQFWLLLGSLACFGFALQVIMVHIVPHITDIGISAIIAASMMTIIGALSLMGKIIMGSASDRIGTKKAFIIAMSLMLANLLWLLVAKEIWMLYLFAAIHGFAYGSQVPLPSPMVAELYGLRSHGVILGVTSFAATAGGAIGPILAGYIFDTQGSYQLAFIISAGVVAVGFILMALLRPLASSGEADGPIKSF
jgi:MFS family permease